MPPLKFLTQNIRAPQLLCYCKFTASSSRATTSSALSRRPSSYDVFINFRGKDTRQNFVSLLYDALKRDKIDAFIDSEELWEGEEIRPSLERAIRGSEISIPVFSEHYADSKFCLLELAQIWESHLSDGQTILPIFIGVEPRDVGRQTGSFEKPFEEHQTNCESAIVEGWKNALRKVGKIKGWTLNGDATIKEQSNIVELVVQRVVRELHSSNPLNEEKYLIGIDSHVKELLHLLHYGSDDVRFVGICGMGGLGKTTIAKAIYNRIFGSFNGSSFLTDVREEASQGNKGLVSLQKQLLHDIFQRDYNISIASKGSKLIAKRLHREKVLIILDDVDDYTQLDALVGGFNWFGEGSKVIITTRDEHILNVHKEKVRQDIQIYNPEELDSKNSLLLFSLHAFSRNEPLEHYKQLSNEVVSYIGGLPLSLEVLGTFLIDKEKKEWEETLEILKDIGNDNNVFGRSIQDYDDRVFKKLEISYNQLGSLEKTIFLDVACYFNGWEKEKAFSLWEACELRPRLAIKQLIQKHLLKIDVPIYGDGELVLKMHDQLIAMGRRIITRDSGGDPTKRKRLWSQEEIWKVLQKDTGTQMVEGMLIQNFDVKAEDEFVSKDDEFEAEDVLSCEAFQKMPNLRFLQFDGIGSLNGEFAHLPSKLRWFRWKGMKILPPDFYHPELVHLELSSCWALKLSWNAPNQNEKKRFLKLKVLNVDFLLRLSLPTDFFLWFPCLQRLSLSQCISLLEFPDSICRLASLKAINVDRCSPFSKLPDLSKLKGLTKLNIRDCNKLEEIHGLTESLEELDVSFCSKLEELPDLSKLQRLRTLSIGFCTNIKKIHGLEGTESLEELDLSSCSKLDELPDFSKLKGLRKLKLQYFDNLEEIHSLAESLEELDASCCYKLKELPDLSKLKRLRKLNILYCKNLEEIHVLEGIESLEELDASFCTKLEELPDLSKLKGLRKLKLRSCTNLEEIRGLTESLEELDASYCFKLKELPNLSKLKRLRYLILKNCENLEEIHGLDGTEYLEELDVSFCSKLKELPDLSKLEGLTNLNIQNCKNLEEIHGLTKSLELLDLSFCSKLKELPDLSKLKRLRMLNIQDCKNLEEIHGLEGTESLEELDASFCTKLEQLPDLSKLKGLRMLKLRSYKNLEEIRGLTESLEELDASFCSKLKELPDLSKLKRLRRLSIKNCENLEEIHGLEGTDFLEELDVSFCSKLKELPDLSKLKRLRYLILKNCENLEEIRGLDGTKYLEELDVSFCSKLKELPDLSKLKRLRYLYIKECKNLEEIHGLEGKESLEVLDASFCSKLKELPDLSKLERLLQLNLQYCENIEKIHGLEGTEFLKELDVSFCSKLKELSDLSKLKRLAKLHMYLEGLYMQRCFKITETTRKILGQGTLVDDDVGQMQGINGSPILCVVFAFTPLGLTQLQAGELGTISLEIDALIRWGYFRTRCLHSIRIEDIKFTTQDIIYIHYVKGFDWFGFPLESEDGIDELNVTIRNISDPDIGKIPPSICDVKLVKVLFENKESNRHMPNQQSSAMLVAEFFRWSDADDAEEVEQKGACLEEEDEDDKDEDQGRLHQPSHVQEKGKTPLEVKLNNRFNLQESPIQQPNIDNEVQRIPSDIEEAERLIGTNNLFSSSYGGLENRIVFRKTELTKNMRQKLISNFLIEK